jgi:hypothetical protein
MYTIFRILPDRSNSMCATVIAGGDPMSPPTHDRELPSENLSLEEQIRRRAHELSLLRGDKPGSALDDWLQAETEILRARNDARVDEASEESFPSSSPNVLGNECVMSARWVVANLTRDDLGYYRSTKYKCGCRSLYATALRAPLRQLVFETCQAGIFHLLSSLR